jgi:hypothetical protein
LPLAPASWANWAERRQRLFRTVLEQWQTEGSFDALARLGRAVVALFDDGRTCKLVRKGKLAVVPSDDFFFEWIMSGEAEAALTHALEGDRVPDELGMALGTALATVTRLTAAR